MRMYFGTDGAPVGHTLITPEFAMKLGYCAGRVLSRADLAPPHCNRQSIARAVPVVSAVSIAG